jgi:DNA segregation ATPase FtsK/SpoIIIE, S-DNA-T family
MARKKAAKKTKKTNDVETEPKLARGVLREIVAILIVLFAVVLLLAAFGWGGSLANQVFATLRLSLGLAAYFIPFIIFMLGWMLVRPARYTVKGNFYFGFLGFILSLASLLHTLVPVSESLDKANAGLGGGLGGYLISTMLLRFVSVIPADILLLGLMLIFLIVAMNARMIDIWHMVWDRKHKASATPELQINEATGSPTAPNNKLQIKGTIGLPKAEATKAKPDDEALTQSTDPDWTPPPYELLQNTSTKADAGNVKENAGIIRETLESFNINVQMGEVNIGPTVTQYTFLPPSGVKLNKITGLDTNLALSLAAHPIRIEAPIPGKSAVGVEIPNKTIATVRLRDVLSSPEVKSQKSPLQFVLGRDVSGSPMSADLARMPHMLIAGATGSGKSVMINAFLTSLLYRNSPSDLKLILVDPKRVELSLYNDIPHLLTPVIVEPEKCISALKWAVAEMERRYKLLAEVGNRNIIEYNKAHPQEAMPYIVIVIDEMADLMVLAAKDVEGLVVRLAQMARAIGIHLVLATQRPSVDVITGLIKANIPARLAFSVASQIDSRTILDQAGAEKLLGKGDMLFSSPEFIKPRRIQGVFLDEKEVKSVTDFLRAARAPQYNEEITTQPVHIGRGGGSMEDLGEANDDMYQQAADTVIRSGKASASLLQRRLRVGYARAARLLDLLEERGVIGAADGARPRDVLVSSMSEVSSGDVTFED